MDNLLKNVSKYVITLLTNKLSSNLRFHNINHTYEVVESAKEIGEQSSLSDDKMLILLTAVWFHDCGYVNTYINHEEESKKIAKQFLENFGCDKEFNEQVLNCIEATKYPQRPYSLIEKVLCDADMYHFTKVNYPKYEKAIRYEFEKYLGLKYTNKEWRKTNYETLVKHNYFTDYGKAVLTKFKEVNTRLMATKTN